MASTIERCVASALSQEDNDFEVIVLDNQSTDSTFSLAAAFSHPRLRVIRNETNLGAYGNHNRCLTIATGEWVKFLHGDDELLAHCLSEMRVAQQICCPGTALIGCGGILHGHDDREQGRTFVPIETFNFRPIPAHEFVLNGNIFGTPTMTFIHRQSLLDLGGFDLALEPAADGDCWIKLVETYPSALLHKHLVILRDDQPASAEKEVRAVVALTHHAVAQATKWHRRDARLTNIPIDKTVYGAWLCRDCIRLWNSALKHALAGRGTALKTLMAVLEENNLLTRSLWQYTRMLLSRRLGWPAYMPWPKALAGFRIAVDRHP